ncbi:MAG: hypothetical protein M1830_003018, partial [Pleopsidium flavum]
ESSDDTSSNTEGGRHDNCESSAGEQSQDSGESNSETGSEDGDNESRADEESQEQHESSEDDESMAEDVNTRKRRRETTPSPSDTSDSQSSHANPQDIVSAKQNNNVTPGTRRTVKRARITPVSSSESSEDARYDSSGVRLSPIPQSPKLQHVMVPKDESLALQSSSSDDEPSDDGLYGPGRDIFSALEDWLSSVS